MKLWWLIKFLFMAPLAQARGELIQWLRDRKGRR